MIRHMIASVTLANDSLVMRPFKSIDYFMFICIAYIFGEVYTFIV